MGFAFFGILVPPGVPKVMIPIMIPIEIISMIARPVLTFGQIICQYDCWATRFFMFYLAWLCQLP